MRTGWPEYSLVAVCKFHSTKQRASRETLGAMTIHFTVSTYKAVRRCIENGRGARTHPQARLGDIHNLVGRHRQALEEQLENLLPQLLLLIRRPANALRALIPCQLAWPFVSEKENASGLALGRISGSGPWAVPGLQPGMPSHVHSALIRG